MKTAVDTNILLGVLLPEPAYLVSSAQAIGDARQHDPLVICELVYAELATQFSSEDELNDLLVRAAIDCESVTVRSAFAAGRMCQEYRRQGGPRTRIMTDFLIGAHAIKQADRLLT